MPDDEAGRLICAEAPDCEAAFLVATEPHSTPVLLHSIYEQRPESEHVRGAWFVTGFVLAAFTLYSLRIALVPWLWNGAGLQYFLPVISPVYREGEHWQAYHTRAAILCHVCFGSAMLVLGAMQCDKSLRTRFKSMHRWCGRAYVICGAATTGSLQVLQESVGSGSSPSGDRSEALAWFVDVTSILWAITTLVAVVAVICKRIEFHRDCMGLSLALACTPIAQRAYSWVACAPLAVAARMLSCTVAGPEAAAARWGLFRLRWGPPGNTLWGDGCVLATDTDISMWDLNPRARPLLFSADGYGEGEQLSFALSAWMAFFTMLMLGLLPLWLPFSGRFLPRTISTELPVEFNIGSAQLFECWRVGAEGVTGVWATNRVAGKLRQLLGGCAKPSFVLVVGAALGVSAIGGAATVVLLTFAFTFAIVVFVFGAASFFVVPVTIGTAALQYLSIALQHSVHSENASQTA